MLDDDDTEIAYTKIFVGGLNSVTSNGKKQKSNDTIFMQSH